jgi:hypothetical protein
MRGAGGRVKAAMYALCGVFVILAVLALNTLDIRLFIASLVAQAAMLITASIYDRRRKP